jgi:hypothetical protein
MLRKWVGTAFGTARLIVFGLSADDALLFSLSRSNPSWAQWRTYVIDIASFS